MKEEPEMLSFLSPERLAARSARNPWLTVGLWVVLVAAAIVSAGDLRTIDESNIRGAEYARADGLLEELNGETPPSETIVVQGAADVDDPRYRTFVGQLVGRLRATEGVVSVSSYYDAGDSSFVSEDRSKTILSVVLTGDIKEAAETVSPLMLVLEESNRDGFSVLTVGDGSLEKEITEQFESDLKSAETIGLPAALIVLLFVFGAGVAAGVPVLIALLSIVVAMGMTAVLSRMFGVSSLVVNMITMIGLAVGIDYTLFIVERFREERARGIEKLEAINIASSTASRAVLFSGITVVIALAGMLVVPASDFIGMAVGAILVVVAAVAAALTLLPAVLSLLGDKINFLRVPFLKPASGGSSENGFWARTTRVVVKHPVIAIVSTVTLLLVAAAPAATIKFGTSGLRDMPTSLQTVQAFDVLDREFSAGRLAPAHIMFEGDVNSPEFQRDVDELRQRLGREASVAEIRELSVNDEGTIAKLDIIIDGDSFGPEALATVDRVRGEHIPAAFEGSETEVYVGGAAASTKDYVDTMKTYFPLVVGFVLTLSFVLLMMVFRSIVIPVKAIVMNLLSVGAAYGLIVLVFQHGVGGELLGFGQTDSIAAFLPAFLFAVLFGLSMDYHVFLLSRVQERFLHTGDNTGAVAYGLRSTAHIITGAAAIMMVVFGGFAMGSMVEMQQVGFGLAVAVFIDATIVRSILVPASMEVLGDRNWYLPSWLQWLPRINVEATPAPAPQPEPQRAPEFIPVGAGGD